MDQNDESKDVQNDPLVFDPNSSSGGVFSTWTPEFVTVLDTHWEGFTGSLRVAYSWETTVPKFRVRSLAYKIVSPTWEHGNKANLSFSIQSKTGSTYESGDNLSQDGQWRTYETPLEVFAKPDGSGYIHVEFTFDRQNAGDPSADILKIVRIFQKPLILTSGDLPAAAPIIRGRDATPGATVALMRPVFATPYGAGLATDTTWAVQSQNIPFGRQEIICRQTFGVFVSEYSNIVTLNLFSPATLSFPTNGAVVRGDTLRFLGGCTPGTTIVVLRSDNNDELLAESPILYSDSWNLGLLFGKLIPTGNVSVRAKYIFESNVGFTDTVTFRVESFPIITPPATGTAFEQPFVISGTGGVLGAQIELLPDLGTSPVYGRGSVTQADGRWSVSVSNVPPGRKGLVAEQTSGGVRSGLGYPVAFDVRPARFVGVNVEIIDTSIKFSGTAHPGATVEITGPAGTVPPPPVTADTGHWSTTATDWPYGTYTAQIIQKVGDGASGWIESLPFEFTVANKLPEVSELAFTPDYQPTFSGKGNARATVWLWEFDRDVAVAPPRPLTVSGPWSSQASEIWGPTLKRRIRIRQAADGLDSEWVYLDVTIPPLAPGLNPPVEDGFSPRLSGTCWPGAVVSIQFSDEDNIVHEPDVVGGTWTFRRDKEFDVGEHTVTVTQCAAEQTSPAVCAKFAITGSMLQPIIIQPDPEGVGRDVTIFGTNGMQDATMQLRDAQFQTLLGPEKTLKEGGVWSIDLKGLKYRRYTIDAQQTLKANPSERSEERHFDVVLLPPEIDQPTFGGKLPRTAKINGRGMANGRVEVFLEGIAEPLLTNVLVSREGRWEGEVTLPLVGPKTIWARQTFVDEDGVTQASKNSPALHFDVVPVAPFIETPLAREQVGREVVVSGFGVPGDTVSVRLSNGEPANATVQADRTWSVRLNGASVSGFRAVEATARCDDFESEPARRMVEQCTYQPVIEEPADGRWISNPVSFAGQGRDGIVRVVSWYNPDVTWVRDLTVTDGAWRGESQVPLPVGGNWCRVGQTLIDEPSGVTGSDWVQSSRFEVRAVSSNH